MFANKSSNAEIMFELHKQYSETIYPKDFNIYEKPIDTREHPLYLKLTPDLYPFLSNPTSLKSATNIKLIKFVADNAIQLQNSLKLLSKSGKTCISTILGDYSFTLGYTNFLEQDEQNLKSFKNLLFSYLDSQNIRDFKHYLEQFLIYSQDYCKENTITTISTFLKKSTSYNTGFSLNFQTFDHNDDTTKVSKFINNESFDDYTRICGQYGFFVNKNAPWNLIANVYSKSMENSMKKNYKSFKEFVDKSNQDVLLYSFNRFRTFLFRTFEEYTQSRKFFSKRGCHQTNLKSLIDNQLLEITEDKLFEIFKEIFLKEQYLSPKNTINFGKDINTRLKRLWAFWLDSTLSSVLGSSDGVEMRSSNSVIFENK